MKKYDWMNDFINTVNENGHFGGNYFYDTDQALQYIKKLDKLYGKIKILDYENIRVTLPENDENAKKLLLHVITTSPLPTDTRYIKRSNCLELTWS